MVLIGKTYKLTKAQTYKYIALNVGMWISAVFIFGLYVLGSMLGAAYSISYDEHFVNTVNQRAFADNGDIGEAVVLFKDAEGAYENKMWKLQNKEIYYLQSFGALFLLLLPFEYIIFVIFGGFKQDFRESLDDRYY